MLDPASIGIAINVCSTAFKAIQRGFEAGREMEAMHGICSVGLEVPQRLQRPKKMLRTRGNYAHLKGWQ
jgi:hypothetical protein